MCSDASGAGDSERAAEDDVRDTPCQQSIANVSTMLQRLELADFDAVDSSNGILETTPGAGSEFVSG